MKRGTQRDSADAPRIERIDLTSPSGSRRTFIRGGAAALTVAGAAAYAKPAMASALPLAALSHPIPPNPTGVSTTTGLQGTAVTITGTNLGTDPAELGAMFALDAPGTNFNIISPNTSFSAEIAAVPLLMSGDVLVMRGTPVSIPDQTITVGGSISTATNIRRVDDALADVVGVNFGLTTLSTMTIAGGSGTPGPTDTATLTFALNADICSCGGGGGSDIVGVIVAFGRAGGNSGLCAFRWRPPSGSLNQCAFALQFFLNLICANTVLSWSGVGNLVVGFHSSADWMRGVCFCATAALPD